MKKLYLRSMVALSATSLIGCITATSAAAEELPQHITREQAIEIDKREAATYAARGLMLASSIPPSCVTVRVDPPGVTYRSVFVTNRCPAQQRVRVIWAFDPDSSCLVINAGKTVEDHHFRASGQERFDGLQNC